jgi:large subunit ribosomal protein L24
MKKIKTGDEVIVIAGKDKGKQGSIIKILENGRCFVSGIQMVKRHTKPNPQAGVAGGLVEKEGSINLSNVSIFNPSSKKADKVSIKILEDGKKVRVFRSSGKEIQS